MTYHSDFCPIFISSSDSYSDLWPTFFRLFKRFWPEYSGIIYLNTEQKSFSCEGLNIICTTVGNHKCFGETFRLGLEKVPSEDLLLIMIDYFFMGRVDNQLMQDYYKYFGQHGYDSICLTKNNYDKSEPTGFKELQRVVVPSQNMFSFQTAFWRKDVLHKMVLTHESPWLSEWYGTKRANSIKLTLAHSVGKQPIPYLDEGALHKGKWVEPMVRFLDSLGISIDYQKRGYFLGDNTSMKSRIISRISTFWPRLLSNANLLMLKISK